MRWFGFFNLMPTCSLSDHLRSIRSIGADSIEEALQSDARALKDDTRRIGQDLRKAMAMAMASGILSSGKKKDGRT